MARERGGIASAALMLSMLAAISAALGLLRDVVIAFRFGASADLDAYLVAQGLMNLALALLAGAMAKATVPVVSRGVAAGEVETAHRSALVAITMTVLVMAVASLVLWLAAAPIMEVLAPGFDGAQQRLVTRLSRVVLIATVLIAGMNLLAAVAQAHRRFFWSGVQGIPFNVAMIVAAAVFGPRYGVTALAVGFVIGSALRFVAQLVPLRAIGLRLRPRFDVGDRGFREIARLLPALLVGSAVTNANVLVDRAVGSGVGDGAVSALNYGWRLATLADMLLVGPLVTTLYPGLGAAAGSRELLRLVERGVSTLAVLLAPIAVVMVVAATPLVTVAFGRGSFDVADVTSTATALAWYAPAVIALGWRDLVARAWYSQGDARTPVVIAVVAMAINIVGDLTLGRRFGIAGLATSTTLAMMAAAAISTWLLVRRHGDGQHHLRGALVRVGMAAALAAGAGFALRAVLVDDVVDTGWPALGMVCVLATGIVGGFVAVLAIVRAPEVTLVVDTVSHLRRRRDRSA